MDKLNLNSNPDVAQKNGVINPYALAEYVSGRKINWQQVEDVPRTMESILRMPYEELFDPKYDGPLYLGLRLNKKGTLERFHSPLLDVEVKLDRNDLEVPIEALMDNVKELGDLGARFKVENIAKIKIHRIELCNPFQIALIFPAFPI